MMPIDFAEANQTFQKPAEMTDEECQSIRAFLIADEDKKRQHIITAWRPNKEDIEAINAGRPIYLHITHNCMPPVWIYTYDEKGEINE